MEEAFIALEPDDSSSPVKSPSSQFKRTFSKQYSRQTSGTGETTSSVPLKHKTDKERVIMMLVCLLMITVFVLYTARGMGQGAEGSLYMEVARYECPGMVVDNTRSRGCCCQW